MAWLRKKVEEQTKKETPMFLNNKTEIEEFIPSSYNEIQTMANAMILQKTIKVNLTKTVVTDRRRIIDFLCGIAYAVGFSVEKTAANIYEFKLEN